MKIVFLFPSPSGPGEIVFLRPVPPGPDGNKYRVGVCRILGLLMYWRSIRSRSGQWLFRGHSFYEPPTETVGRRPCSHGGGPLRELDGQCPPSPIAGSPVPCSAPSGALRRNIKRYAGTHRPPAQRLPPSATGPREGGAAGYGPPLLRGFGLPLRVTTPPGTQAPGSVGLGLSPPVPARRSAAVSAPPLASLRPAGGSDGSGTRSCGSPLGCSGWACGPPYAPLRVRLRPFCAGASAGPPKTAPARRGWSLGPLAPPRRQGYGLRSSRLGPGAALRAAFSGPRPQAFLEEAARGIKFVREVGRVLELSAAVRRQG